MRIEDLKKYYGSVHAVDGILTPTQGKVSFRDRVIDHHFK